MRWFLIIGICWGLLGCNDDDDGNAHAQGQGWVLAFAARRDGTEYLLAIDPNGGQCEIVKNFGIGIER